jgi:NADPH:quinone reductase-like Zn-dependent oxidoreductase
MKAIYSREGHNAALIDVPIPRLRSTYLLIRVHAVGLNPLDAKLIDFMGPANRMLGCEVAGVVQRVGRDVTLPFKEGDRIVAVTHGGNNDEAEDGAFGEYAVVKGDVAIKIPDWMGWEEAATLPMGAYTAGMGLYQHLKLPLPDAVQGEEKKKKTAVLIYGASSGMGMYCLKLAKL